MTTTVGNPFKLNITANDSGPWVPPYNLPVAPGEVIKIAGDEIPTSATVTCTGGDTTGSTYPTNVFRDVAPPESGGTPDNLLYGGDTRTKFIESYSRGGAIVIAGSGGHGGTSNFGACLFDFEDARWKRVWTTDGNPGVDNVSNGLVDKRYDTKVHGVVHHTGQMLSWFGMSSTHGSPCWHPDHWQPGGGATDSVQRTLCPLTPDPRHQTWEISRSPTDSRVTYFPENPHGWPYTPEEFGGDGLNNRFPRTGYVAPSSRFDPILAGTLEPTQSELPAPGHIWDHLYELKPEHGGGPRGSIITGWMQNAGGSGVTSLNWSMRYDLYTGIWHEFSTNAPSSYGQPTPPPGGGPRYQADAVASAQDYEFNRIFLIAKEWGNASGRINYMNLDDRTWRNFYVGTGGGVPDRLTEYMVVDPDRRLLIIVADNSPHLFAFDLQTLGQTGTPEPTPSHGLGGAQIIPYDDIPGVTSVPPYIKTPIPPFPHGGQVRMPWRYYPPNGKFYRANGKSMAENVPPPNPNVPVLQRLTPPPIIPTPRPNFYYTTESMSGRWTLDEIEINVKPGPEGGLPAPQQTVNYVVCGFSWFHYVPALQCMAYAPLDFTFGSSSTRRCVYLIKPY